MRKRRTPPGKLVYIARMRSAGLRGLHAFVRQAVADDLASSARRLGAPQAVVLEAAIAEGLKLPLGSLVHQAYQQRLRAVAVHASSVRSPEKNS